MWRWEQKLDTFAGSGQNSNIFHRSYLEEFLESDVEIFVGSQVNLTLKPRKRVWRRFSLQNFQNLTPTPPNQRSDKKNQNFDQFFKFGFLTRNLWFLNIFDLQSVLERLGAVFLEVSNFWESVGIFSDLDLVRILVFQIRLVFVALLIKS